MILFRYLLLLILASLYSSELFAGRALDPIKFQKRYRQESKMFSTEKSSRFQSRHRFNDKTFNSKIIKQDSYHFQDKKFNTKDYFLSEKKHRNSKDFKKYDVIKHKEFQGNGKEARIAQKEMKEYKSAPIGKNRILARIDQLAEKYDKSPNQTSLREINKDVPLMIRSDEPGFPVNKAGSE